MRSFQRATIAMSSTAPTLTLRRYSTLTPSADLTTTIQSSSWQGVLPSAGFWQINAKSGDLQFCLALQGQSDLYRPINGCIKLDWKTAKPF